jgi:hypothetical protein
MAKDTTAADIKDPDGTKPVERYRVAMYGGGIEEIDRLEARDRIRRREILATTELAHAGTDDWKRALQYPELSRYLALAAEQVSPQRQAAPKDGPVEAMTERIVRGLLYPIQGLEFVTLLGIAVLSALPGISLIMIPVATVYIIAIVKSSANGKTKMPAWVETDDIPAMFVLWLRTCLVSLIALWPIVLWGTYWYFTTPEPFTAPGMERLLPGGIVAGLVSLVYYPACLATIAVWDSVSASLNPAFVARVIRIIGRDYFIAIGTAVAAIAIALLTGRAVDSVFGGVPLLGSVLRRLPVLWAEFYAAHLLGYAVFRHATALGWE